MVLGVIGGSGLLKTTIFSGFDVKTISTEYGKVKYREGIFEDRCSVIFIQRHEADPDVPYSQPHLINYCAIMTAFTMLNVNVVVAVCSAGSCNTSIRVGSVIVPGDYICVSLHLFPCLRSNLSNGAH